MARTLLTAGLVMVFLPAGHAGAQWGSLTGRVVLDGNIPNLPPRFVGPVRGVPGNVVIPDDTLVIDPKSKGIANVAVWLVKKPAEIHPDVAIPQPKKVDMIMRGLQFSPHLMIVRTDQQVQFLNRDPMAHNPRATAIRNPQFGAIVAPNGESFQQFRLAERLPVPVTCDIHPFMRAYWLVLDHPYAAITDQDGNFKIDKLPVGEHEFKVWHERAGFLVKDAQNPKRGLVVTIQDGAEATVPDILVPVKKLTEPGK